MAPGGIVGNRYGSDMQLVEIEDPRVGELQRRIELALSDLKFLEMRLNRNKGVFASDVTAIMRTLKGER